MKTLAVDGSVLSRFKKRLAPSVRPNVIGCTDRRHQCARCLVGDAEQRLATQGNNDVEPARHSEARERGVGDETQAFAREVVDHGENPEAPPPGSQELQGRTSSLSRPVARSDMR